MKICDELRQAVLQAAIQGKLTRQRKEDGEARDLLKQITEEKAQLIKEKKIKKEKPLPEIAEAEVPFDIPDNWVWVRLGTLSYQIQYGYNAPAKSFGRIKMVRISDIDNNTVDWENVPFCDINDEEIATYLLHENDLLFARTGGTVGKSFLVTNIDCEAVYAGYLIRTRYNDNCVLPKYMKMFMETQLYWSQLRNGTIATAQPNCNGQTLSKMMLPLPPLAEQQRIVAKVEKLMAEIDELEKIENELIALKEAFPGDMKAALLQTAMQGKLTTQRKEDGNAKDLLKQITEEKARLVKEGKLKKEKPLAEISEDEIPFDIPENWEWVRMQQVLDIRDGTHDTPKYVEKGIPFITSKNLVNGNIDLSDVKYISNDDAAKINQRSLVEDGDIIMAMIGSIGNPVKVKKTYEFSIKNVALIKYIKDTGISMDYVLVLLRFMEDIMKEQATGGVQKFVSLNYLRDFIVPLPPFAEQERIVAKLDKLLPLVEGLKEE